ncbi:exopolysaccharide biosynthesis polyprenyl glycosylphosphotransferase [Paludisphaera rhizosphaerae]|uniref:exopolysaccharide biosynthesis polyprenyl glycosylphosphotransferase n=1 Tax=Paludisphaera rhizosphaerae TaxID=2711216 RepID=UPI0013EE1064|nr:exopolysaccharide biosynthesis polyprenyl glycosylphosphotransferase [Paludisphaera rhizosphaerae]
MNDSLEIVGRERVGELAGRSRKRIVIVGAPRDARKLLRDLHSRPVPIVGFIDAGHHRTTGPRSRGRHLAVNPRTSPLPVLGDIDRLDEIVDLAGATHVLVAHSKPRKHLRRRLARISSVRASVHWIAVGDHTPDLAGLDLDSSTPFEPSALDLRAAWAGVRKWAGTDGARLAKRASDVIVSLTLLLLFAPLFLVVAAAILVTSGRPIFYTQERIGQGGRLFRIIKFRSMKSNAEDETGPIWASDHDARCTRIGDWLRHTNVDELPQLFNVLKGDMSLVGPRPERPIFVEQFSAGMPDYNLRHAVPCGMTGWAQVHGWRGRTSLRKRIQYDLDYINRWSFWIDFRILFMTFQHVAWGKISWNISRTPKRPQA